jgi:hypothetical protein
MPCINEVYWGLWPKFDLSRPIGRDFGKTCNFEGERWRKNFAGKKVVRKKIQKRATNKLVLFAFWKI